MNSLVTILTMSNSIRNIKYKFRKVSHRFDVMSFQVSAFIIATAFASIIVPLKDGLSPLLIFGGTPISFFVGCVFAVFILRVQFSTFPIHWIIISNHTVRLPFDCWVTFFGQTLIPRRLFIWSKNISDVFSSLRIISPLKGYSFTCRPLWNTENPQSSRDNPISNSETSRDFTNSNFIDKIPFSDESLPRIVKSSCRLFEILYSFILAFTFKRAKHIFGLVNSIFSSIKFGITNRAIKDLSVLSHIAIIAQQQRIYT